MVAGVVLVGAAASGARKRECVRLSHTRGRVQDAGCIEMDEQDGVAATMAGRIASFYYLQHETMDLFMHHIHADADLAAVLKILASSPEYDELPVRTRHRGRPHAAKRTPSAPVHTGYADFVDAGKGAALEERFRLTGRDRRPRAPHGRSDAAEPLRDGDCSCTHGHATHAAHVAPAAVQVRHNEDKLNTDLSRSVRWPVDPALCDLPHTKANLLFQAHLGRVPLPLSDYVTDTKLTLDNAIRLLQAMIDVAASQGFLHATLACIRTLQVPPPAPHRGRTPAGPTHRDALLVPLASGRATSPCSASGRCAARHLAVCSASAGRRRPVQWCRRSHGVNIPPSKAF